MVFRKVQDPKRGIFLGMKTVREKLLRTMKTRGPGILLCFRGNGPGGDMSRPELAQLRIGRGGAAGRIPGNPGG